MELSGKTVVVTGSSSGIGHALAEQLFTNGANVYGLDCVETNKAIDGIHYLKADITNAKQLQKALSSVRGSIHILINNAAIMRRGTITESSEKDFDDLFGVNVKGSWLTYKLAQPHLAEDATIVQVSSTHALHPPSNPGLYGLTKQTTMHLARIIAQTYPGYRVKIVYPGPVDTPMLTYERTQDEISEHRLIADTPGEVASKIITLITSDTDITLTWEYESGNKGEYKFSPNLR